MIEFDLKKFADYLEILPEIQAIFGNRIFINPPINTPTGIYLILSYLDGGRVGQVRLQDITYRITSIDTNITEIDLRNYNNTIIKNFICENYNTKHIKFNGLEITKISFGPNHTIIDEKMRYQLVQDLQIQFLTTI